MRFQNLKKIMRSHHLPSRTWMYFFLETSRTVMMVQVHYRQFSVYVAILLYLAVFIYFDSYSYNYSNSPTHLFLLLHFSHFQFLHLFLVVLTGHQTWPFLWYGWIISYAWRSIIELFSSMIQIYTSNIRGPQNSRFVSHCHFSFTYYWKWKTWICCRLLLLLTQSQNVIFYDNGEITELLMWYWKFQKSPYD